MSNNGKTLFISCSSEPDYKRFKDNPLEHCTCDTICKNMKLVYNESEIANSINECLHSHTLNTK